MKQARAGRLFLHEHPAHATSWKERCILEVLQLKNVSRITADQCQMGQQTDAGEPIMKQTGFMSNCPDILDRLHRRCSGKGGWCSRPQGGKHQLCNAKVARRAAIFQRELCEEILIGLKNYLTRHRRMRNNEQFYTEGCGVMIDGDDDVRLHYRQASPNTANAAASQAGAARAGGAFARAAAAASAAASSLTSLACLRAAATEAARCHLACVR